MSATFNSISLTTSSVTMGFEPVIYLGGNLNRAIVWAGEDKVYLMLDGREKHGREKQNPEAFTRHGVSGLYEVTNTHKNAAGMVSYWGRKVDKIA